MLKYYSIIAVFMAIIGYGIWFLNKLNFDFYTLGFITSIFILNFTLLILIFAESIKNQKKLTSNT